MALRSAPLTLVTLGGEGNFGGRHAMRKHLVSAILVVAVILSMGAAEAEDSLATSGLWFGPILRARFPDNIPIHGWEYPISEIPCLPSDITKFSLTAGTTTAFGVRAFAVRGSVLLGAIPSPFEVFDGAQGRRYMLHLQAYLFSPGGKLVWTQQGFPSSGAWVHVSGASADFTLIDSYQGPIQGHELIVLAAGDPVLSSSSESRVILGVKRVVLQ